MPQTRTGATIPKSRVRQAIMTPTHLSLLLRTVYLPSATQASEFHRSRLPGDRDTPPPYMAELAATSVAYSRVLATVSTSPARGILLAPLRQRDIKVSSTRSGYGPTRPQLTAQSAPRLSTRKTTRPQHLTTNPLPQGKVRASPLPLRLRTLSHVQVIKNDRQTYYSRNRTCAVILIGWPKSWLMNEQRYICETLL